MQRKIIVAFGLAVFVFTGSTAHTGVDTAAVCKEKKARAAGKRASDLLKAFGKNEARPSPPRLVIDVSKARSKFERAFSRVEAKGGCPTSGDAGTIEAKVDAFVTDAVGRLCPSCGDGILAPSEECDDANLEDGDGCSALCVVEAGWSCGGEASSCSEICGDGIVVGLEECDDGDLSDEDPCLTSCLAARCGDGFVCSAPACATAGPPTILEGCDPGGAPYGGCCSPECVSEAGECCTLGQGLLSFETGIASGSCGVLRSFRCSNNGSTACTDDGDCDAGPCFVTPPFCQGDFSIPCSDDSDCTGTCGEISGGNLPLDLECGGVYLGGGLNSIPLPAPAPDRGEFFLRVESCNETTGEMTLGMTTPAEVGTRHCTQGRQCSDDDNPCVMDEDCVAGTCQDLCLIGAPMPLPNSGTPATSVCVINVIADDATGTAQCNGGETELDLGLRAVVYLNGDLFKASTPPDLPGVQPCPLCVPICLGGSNDGWPCRPDNGYAGTTEYSDCVNGGGTCPSASECLGGLDDGNPCTPETSDPYDLRDDQDSYPTSHDCRPDPFSDVTSTIGGVPVSFRLNTGTEEWTAVDRENGRRNFCGYCRDVLGGGSLCFEGDDSYHWGCPPAIPPTDGNAVPCASDADCQADADEYESCVQRDPGAFSEGASTRLSVAGSADGGCLADGQLHPAQLTSLFCMAPTHDITVNAAADLPGPGAVMLQGDLRLQ